MAVAACPSVAAADMPALAAARSLPAVRLAVPE